MIRWAEACGGLVRFRTVEGECEEDDTIVVDYYARGVGWTSYGAAQSSWTADEQRKVTEWRLDQAVCS